MKAIPQHLIKHLQKPSSKIRKKTEFSVDDLINNYHLIESDDMDQDTLPMQVASALSQVEWGDSIMGDRYVTMPQLMRALGLYLFDPNSLEQEAVTVNTQEIIAKNITSMHGYQPEIYVVTHGFGPIDFTDMIAADKSGDWYSETQLPNKQLLNILHAEQHPIYSIDDVKNQKVKDPFGTYAVWLNKQEMKKSFGMKTREELLSDPFMLARAGSPDNLELFLESHYESQYETMLCGAALKPDDTKPRAELIGIGYDMREITTRSCLLPHRFLTIPHKEETQ